MFSRKLAIGIFLILGLLFDAVALGAELNYQVDRSVDDAFKTETGGYFESSPYVAITDPTYGLSSYFLFRNVMIYNSRIINNATLSVYTTSGQDADLTISATIYGLEVGSGGLLNRLSMTTAYENWNISQVRGIGAWHNVTVTPIVQELIDRYGWDYGDNLAFEILATSGALRQVVAYDYGNPTLTAKLYISYGTPPSSPASGADPPYNDTSTWTWTYNQTYQDYDIWEVVTVNQWVNFSTFTRVGADGPAFTQPNSTALESRVNWETNDDLRNEKIFTYTGPKKVKFGVKWVDFTDVTPASERFYLVLYAYQENQGTMLDAGGDKIVLTSWSDNNGHVIGYQIYAFNGTDGYVDKFGGSISSFPTTHWISFYYDFVNGKYRVRVYSDMAMTNQLFTTWGDIGLSGMSHDFEYCPNFAAIVYPSDRGKWFMLSDVVAPSTVWIATDNGTVVGIDDNLDDILDLIDGVNPDPQDPEPAQWEDEHPAFGRFRMRLYALVIGWGMFWGPIWFFCYVRPSGYHIGAGFIMMLIGLGLLLQIPYI